MDTVIAITAEDTTEATNATEQELTNFEKRDHATKSMEELATKSVEEPVTKHTEEDATKFEAYPIKTKMVQRKKRSSNRPDSTLKYEACRLGLSDIFDSETWNQLGKKLNELRQHDLSRVHFRDIAACEKFYYLYAKVKGFTVWRVSATRSRTDNCEISKRMRCSKYYLAKKSRGNKVDEKESIQTDESRCLATIMFKLTRSIGLWLCEEFITDHNHDLTAPQEIPECSVIGLASNRHQTLGFIPRISYNNGDMVRKGEVKDVDVESVFAYLSGRRMADPSLFLEFTRNKENCIEKLFWCDAQSINDYNNYGQAIAIDTSLKKNVFSIPFVVLVGVNNNNETVHFASALAVDGTEESFKWILKQLIKAGDGMSPLTVVSEDDENIRSAIKEVLPDARHRFCLWHIIHELKSKAPPGFIGAFMYCVHECATAEHFEFAWDYLTEILILKKYDWVQKLYEDKENWAEAFLRGHFFAGIRSAKRCGILQRTLEKLVDEELLWYMLIIHYELTLKAVRFERETSNRSSDPKIDESQAERLKKVFPGVIDDATKHYSSFALQFILNEMSSEEKWLVKRSDDEGDHEDSYVLTSALNAKLQYRVNCDESNTTIVCSCKMLESVGLPCRHIFAVIKFKNIKVIPRGCILRRWTCYKKKSPKLLSTSGVTNGEQCSVDVFTARESNLHAMLKPLVDNAIHTEDDYEDASKRIRDLVVSYEQNNRKRRRKANSHNIPQKKTEIHPEEKNNCGIPKPESAGRKKTTSVDTSSAAQPEDVPNNGHDVPKIAELHIDEADVHCAILTKLVDDIWVKAEGHELDWKPPEL